MSFRFSELMSPSQKSGKDFADDFVMRQRRPIWQDFLVLFLFILIVSMVMGILLGQDILMFSAVMFLLLIGSGTYIFIVLQNNRDLLIATEFQNAMFSSALSSSSTFSIIINEDSTIAHIDRPFQELFPEFYKETRRTMDILFEHAKVSKEDRKLIYSAIEKGGNDQVVFDMTDSRNRPHKIIMSVTPISRPKGFILLRGREFVEKRIVQSELEQSPIFDASSMGMFSYITDGLDMGSYITDRTGRITFVNRKLEDWLYFDEGELVSNGLSIQDIVIIDDDMPNLNGLHDFEGEVQMHKKTGGSIKTSIKQRAIFNNDGSLIGYAAFINRIEDKPTTKKISTRKKAEE